VTTELQQNRYDQLLRRVGDLKGQGSKVSEVLSELFPTFDVENIPHELFLLSGARICAGSATQAAVASQRSRIQLFNPAGSTALVTVTGFSHFSGTANIMVMGLVSVALATTVVTERDWDTRLGILSSPIAQIRQTTNVAAGPSSFNIRTDASANQFIQNQKGIAVLAPGTGLEFTCGINNTAMTIGLFWRERQAEPSELNF